MKENAKKLRKYIEGISTPEEKIRTLLEIERIAQAGLLDSDEEMEYSAIATEVLVPVKTVNGRTVIDAEEFEKVTEIFQRMNFESAEILTDAARRSYVDRLEKNGELIQEERSYDPNGIEQTEFVDVNRSIASMEVSMLPESTMHSMHGFLTNRIEWDRYGEYGGSFMEALKGNGEFQAYLRDRALKNYNGPEEDETKREEHVKNYIRKEEEKGLKYMGLRYYLFIDDSVWKEKKKKNPHKLEDISEFRNPSFEKKIEKVGYDHKALESASKFSYQKGVSSFGKPWFSKEENNSFYLRSISKKSLAEFLSPEELSDRMDRIGKLHDEMVRSMSAIFYDTTQYKEMMAAMKHVKALCEKGERTREECENAMTAVIEKAGIYIDTHSSNRSTPNGRKRFEAAFAAMGIVNEDIADCTAKKINEIRSTEKNPQVIDLKQINRHLPMAKIKPAAISGRIDRYTEKYKKPMSEDEYFYRKEFALFKSSWTKLFGDSLKETVEELNNSGNKAGVDFMNSEIRAASNILAYLQWKHPEYKGMTAYDLTEKDIYRKAVDEYQEFLDKNAVYADAGKKVTLPDSVVRKHLANQAEFHQGWISNLQEVKIEAYDSAESRKHQIKEIRELKEQIIDCTQNMEPLLTVNLSENSTGQVYYLDVYKGGAEQYADDKAFLLNSGALLKGICDIDDPDLQFCDKLLGRMTLQYLGNHASGMTLGEYFHTEEGKHFADRVDSLKMVLSQTESWPAEQKESCMDFIYNGGEEPGVVSDFMKRNKDVIDSMYEQFGMQRKESGTKIKAYKEKKTTERQMVGFKGLMGEEEDIFEGQKEIPNPETTAKKLKKNK